MASLAEKAREHWSVLFTVAVVAFLALSSMNLGGIMPDINWARAESSAPTAQDAATDESPGTTLTGAAGTFTFAVTAFRIAEVDGAYEARITLDVENTGSGIARFHPEQVTLSRNGGGGIRPNNEKLFAMDVSPHISQLMPLRFNVNATPGATYKLTYAGTTIFSGVPS